MVRGLYFEFLPSQLGDRVGHKAAVLVVRVLAGQHRLAHLHIVPVSVAVPVAVAVSVVAAVAVAVAVGVVVGGRVEIGVVACAALVDAPAAHFGHQGGGEHQAAAGEFSGEENRGGGWGIEMGKGTWVYEG